MDWLFAPRAFTWTTAGVVLVGIALACIGFGFIVRVSGECPGLSLNAQFAGLPNAGAKGELAACGTESLGAAVGWDFLLMCGYLLASTGLILVGWWRYNAPQLKALGRFVPFLPFVVFVIDALENVATLLAGCGDHICDVTSGWPIQSRVITTLATAKWLLVFVLVVVVLMSLVVCLSQRGKEPPRSWSGQKRSRVVPGGDDFIDRRKIVAADEFNKGRDPISDDFGLAASGGGIRSTAFTLGALEALEHAKMMNKVRRITAVSGGSWGATAWVLEMATQEDEIARAAEAVAAGKVHFIKLPKVAVARAVVDRLLSTPSAKKGQRPWAPVRYLLNGPGGILRPVLWVVVCAATTLALLVALVYSLSWVPGYALGRPFLFAAIGSLESIPLTWDNPGFYLILVGLILMVPAAFTHYIVRVWKPLAAVVGLGVVAYIYTGLIPALFWLVRKSAADGLENTWAYLLGVVGVSSVGAQLWRFVGGDIESRATQFIFARLPKLLGVLLAMMAAIGGFIVAYWAAFDTTNLLGGRRTTVVLMAMIAILIACYAFVGPNRPSINQIFRKRLERSFAPIYKKGWDTSMYDAGTWNWLEQKKSVPELVICCAQQRNGIAPGGLPADSLTISPQWVTRGYEKESTKRYLARVGKVKWLRVCREYPSFDLVAPWMAISGAAFSSAMGSKSLGSTNAALAAVNADLGVWIPAIAPGDRVSRTSPRTRTAYILKEVLGWYSPKDAYVFATDGGHWENLGLVEQLRSSYRKIICVDASGDSTGSFATLREAIDLAQLELQAKITITDLEAALEPLKATGSQLPKTVATRIPFTVNSGPGSEITGTIYYAKLQISADMDQELRLFAKEDLKFPTYSTLNQFLSDRQFAALVAAGNHAGACVARLYREDSNYARLGVRRSDGGFQ
ncbi:patatin-like phospholipase family protein [Williamsia muralis]|uniref:Patatin-like phospholipase family protein n=1 Tax=Williamsia marianensis TaxID=85044 RepID=A0ABU4ESN5_WILMA|nr:patatin-like phospholipase family protein [Williamsia muralis]MDV7133649.1 patatin-like phospholipase family protein [Williamsia muralis]